MMNQMIDATSTETNESVVTGIVITAHVGKRAVSSEITHVREASKDELGNVVEHSARRFERATACPVATAQALFARAHIEFPRVPVELRYA